MSGRPSGLTALLAIDRLEVGAPRLTARRLSVPYRVVQGGSTDATELLYRWEEDVFRPDEPASQNLAAMIGAQIALNYGLFAREIVFEGDYDEFDRRFLEEMARNTAREIYVKKLLEPNPFLIAPALDLEPEPVEDYLVSRLIFPGAPPAKLPAWTTERGRHAVLSSGGKDSLLTFGVLRELGLEVHPLYVNESGRHWYTALNAYRHMAATWETTGRIWTNSDRLFSWMLRHLPFVRQDFATVRSDEYPIRLWTVAVFLFGALPLLRQRGIGRLLLGDEYDTSDRRTSHGIQHYNGLYDQSRWFDREMSRYFRRKSWKVSQFSIIRPLSELLIEKLLVERYPDLLRHQVSCHATHLEGERALPCGRCEKCRRIVGMLSALGADPAACGYEPDQVEACLKSLRSHGIHTETEGAEHLGFLLARAGLLPEGGGALGAREHPEVMSLRFDTEHSPIDAVPVDLRRPVWSKFAEHAEGALRRRGRVWIPLDLRHDPALDRPYRFEGPRPGEPVVESAGAERSDPYILGELSWPQARAKLRETDIALLPVGAIEQHGPHLPLDIDAWDADHLARRVAEACSAPRPLVLPLVPYGVSYHHDDFAGTLSVSPEALSRIVYDVGMAAARHGITKLVIVNGHGGNVPTLQFAAQMINRDARIFTCVDTGETSDADVGALIETENDVHAGEAETSTALATRPELVHMDKAKRFVPSFQSRYLDYGHAYSVEWYAPTARLSRTGVLGDPTRATREKGEQIWKLMIDHLVALVESLKGLSLDEIHERKH